MDLTCTFEDSYSLFVYKSSMFSKIGFLPESKNTFSLLGSWPYTKINKQTGLLTNDIFC